MYMIVSYRRDEDGPACTNVAHGANEGDIAAWYGDCPWSQLRAPELGEVATLLGRGCPLVECRREVPEEGRAYVTRPSGGWLSTNESAREFLAHLTGRTCVPCEGGETGTEGSVDFYDADTGRGYTLWYRWVPCETGGPAEVSYGACRNETWDTITGVERFEKWVSDSQGYGPRKLADEAVARIRRNGRTDAAEALVEALSVMSGLDTMSVESFVVARSLAPARLRHAAR